MPRNDGSRMPASELQGLKASLQGEVLVKGEADTDQYRAAIARWNMLHVKEANIVVFVETEDDVANTVRFAAKHTLDVAISAGRHTYSGPSSGTGLIIDLRRLRAISLDQTAQTVTAGGGCLAGELESAADKVGLRACFGAINETGIGGITTGGGLGPLSGQYGLVCDSLLSARVVLADGSIVVASKQENEDLFWAIRGGGSNFGICTEFTYQLHESRGDVYAAFVLFRPDQLRACCTLANDLYHNAVVPSAGRLSLVLSYAALAGPHTPVFGIVYDGPESEAKSLLAPMFGLGPINVMEGMKPYPRVTDYDALKPMYLPDFNRFAASSAQIPYPLDVDVMVQASKEMTKVVESKEGRAKPSLMFFDLRFYRRVAEVPKDATAYAHRVEGCLAMVDLAWNDHTLDEDMLGEARRIAAMMRKTLKSKGKHENGPIITNPLVDGTPETNGHTAVNGDSAVNGHSTLHGSGTDPSAVQFQKGLMEEDDDDDGAHMGSTTLYALLTDGKEKIMSVYGSNLPRLRQLKRKFDPHCMWDKWYPIEPASEA